MIQAKANKQVETRLVCHQLFCHMFIKIENNLTDMWIDASLFCCISLSDGPTKSFQFQMHVEMP